MVIYGKDHTWTEERKTHGSIGCNNGEFGDPWRGTKKECDAEQQVCRSYSIIN